MVRLPVADLSRLAACLPDEERARLQALSALGAWAPGAQAAGNKGGRQPSPTRRWGPPSYFPSALERSLLPGLRALDLTGCCHQARVLAARTPYLDHLRWLRLSGADPQAALALGGAVRVASLVTLEVDRPRPTLRLPAALTSMPGLRAVVLAAVVLPQRLAVGRPHGARPLRLALTRRDLQAARGLSVADLVAAHQDGWPRSRPAGAPIAMSMAPLPEGQPRA